MSLFSLPHKFSSPISSELAGDLFIQKEPEQERPAPLVAKEALSQQQAKATKTSIHRYLPIEIEKAGTVLVNITVLAKRLNMSEEEIVLQAQQGHLDQLIEKNKSKVQGELDQVLQEADKIAQRNIKAFKLLGKVNATTVESGKITYTIADLKGIWRRCMAEQKWNRQFDPEKGDEFTIKCFQTSESKPLHVQNKIGLFISV